MNEPKRYSLSAIVGAVFDVCALLTYGLVAFLLFSALSRADTTLAAIVSICTGSAAILWFVRRVNRDTDPRHANRPPDAR